MDFFFSTLFVVSICLLFLLAIKVGFFIFFSVAHFRDSNIKIDNEDPSICYTPLVSIIVPAYNEELVLVNCVESLVALEYSSFEIIVVDDGSSDNTKAVGKELEKIYSNVRFISKKNGGKASALNHGISKSKETVTATIVFIFVCSNFPLPPHLRHHARQLSHLPRIRRNKALATT